jgi:4-hydroxyphenylacetate 3-monooxygenase
VSATTPKTGIRTGREYLESLAGERQVWLEGKRVENVVEHPAFAGAAQSVAEMYDLQHVEGNGLAVPGPNGGLVSFGYEVPRWPGDLRRRRTAVELLSRRTGGMMGRLPEYGTAFAISLLSIAEDFGPEHAARVESWFAQCRDTDVCLITSFVDPQVDKTKPAFDSGLLRVVSDTPDGVVLSGCKSVATLGPLSNEFMIITAPRQFAADGEVIYVSIPTDSPGLRFYCRRAFRVDRSPDDHPLAARFDEPDAWALFDEVFVPRERIFLAGTADVTKVAALFRNVLPWPHYHNLARMSVKAKLLAGVCSLIAEHLNTWRFPQVRESVGQVIEYAVTVDAYLRAAEEDCTYTPRGFAMPNLTVLSVAKLFAVQNYPRMLEILRELSGQGIIMAPTQSDFASEIGPDLERYFSTDDVTAGDRARLFNLAWDLACDSFAGRQVLFELFNAGGISLSRLGVANSADRSTYVALAKELAGIGPDT